MGGDLTASSRPGEGSVFSFTFVAVEASSEARSLLERGRVVGVKPGQPRHRVLVVDDVPDNVRLAVSLLREVGFDAEGTASGEAGIERHDAWQPALILMDLRMPGIGGIEAIRRLRATGSKARLLAFTASGFDELTDAARAAGADDVVFKPYRETQLLEKIALLLNLELAYEGDTRQQPLRSRAPEAPLASLLQRVPVPLREQLREAVLQARAQRVESLANEVDAFSSDAASQVRAMARDFRYEELADALAEA
jgi:CheY-like chemotaxis protein